MRDDWFGLLKIIEIEHRDADGSLLWRGEDIYNMFHTNGQQFVLNILFNGSTVPANYYIGLDNRSSIAASDTMSTIVSSGSEPPITSGYVRATLASSGIFTIATNGSVTVVTSPVITFSSASGGWGPVNNIFLTDASDNSGHLISSAVLPQSITLTSNQSVNLRFNFSLKDCPS